MRFLRILLRLLLVFVTATTCAIFFVGLQNDVVSCDVAVVLGAGVHKNGIPSQRLAARLDKAIELYRQNRFAMVIVSGGIDQDGTDEAKAMRNYLAAQHIPLEAILMDNQGFNTQATAKNTAMLMQIYQLHNVMIISQFFHIPRTRLALYANGIRDVHSAFPRNFERRDVYSVFREVLAIPYYLIVEYL